MINKAIELMEKEKEMYIIQSKNISLRKSNKDIEKKIKKKLRDEIILRDFILDILKEKSTENY